jgi:deoxyribonuclease-4
VATSERARLGAHMSIEGGFHRAVERAAEVDALALQIFAKSARQWRAPKIEEAAAERFRSAARAAGLAAHTMTHASYLINLASADSAVRERSIRALADEIERCAQLGVPFTVLHPGSHVGAGEERGIERVAAALKRVLSAAADDGVQGVTVLLENTAGQGTNLGRRFTELGAILDACDGDPRLGVCLDTCHALAAGYEFGTDDGYRAAMDELENAVGLARVRAFHLNDSRFELGSRRDRHEHIGAGFVGLSAFARLLNDERFFDRPMVLETPKEKSLDLDRKNLATLRGLLPEKRR